MPEIKRNPQFCMAPWVHLSVWPTGNVFPCCIYDWNSPVANVNETGLAGAWNSEAMRALRLRMLKGESSPGCATCDRYDKIGVLSYRHKMNSQYAHHADVVDTTQADGSVEKLNLAYFDNRFSNLCNMKCRTCGPVFSSRWEEETNGKPKVVEIEHPGFWEEVDRILPHVEEFYFTGGESLIMNEHYALLEKLVARGLKPKLTYNSNATKLGIGRWHVKDLWPHFDKVDYFVSVDQIGEKAQYARHGQKWETVYANLKWIRANLPHVKLKPSPTISVFNILDLGEIVRFLLREGLCSDSDMNLNNILVTPEHFSITGLPRSLKRKAERELASLRTWLLSPEAGLPRNRADALAKGCENVVSFMNKSQDYGRVRKTFREKIDAVDVKRGESFPVVFPELKKLHGASWWIR